jgi:hypothetical protein
MGQRINKLYADLRENKITKDFFVRAARRDHINIISPVNTYSDIIKILKNKGLVSEAELSTAQIIVTFGNNFALNNFSDNFSRDFS